MKTDGPYTIDLSDEDNTMHLSKDGGPTICTDWNSAAPLEDFLKLAEHANIGASISESKADPKEKELYSIKPLEWVSVARRPYNSYLTKEKATPSFGLDYSIIYDGENFWWRYGAGEKMPCENTEDGKRQAQDHFISKLKLCLNREL